MAKLFIGGLSWSTDEKSLQDAFGKYGDIEEARVIVDRNTGKSKGFGFVTFAKKEDANEAVEKLNNTDLDGRTIRVDFAKPEGERSDRRSAPYERRDGGRFNDRDRDDYRSGGSGGRFGGNTYRGRSSRDDDRGRGSSHRDHDD